MSVGAFLAAWGGVFTWSFLNFWSAVPMGLGLGLSPLVVILTVTASYITGMALVLFFGERVRAWVHRRWKFDSVDQNSRLYRVSQRWGVIGFGLIAPMTVGSQIGAIIGLTLNMPTRRLFLWMTIGALLWAILLTGGVLLGVLGVQSVTQG